MIVQKIYKQGGRFVKEINGADTYNETEAVSHKQALEKTSQALREKKIPAAQAARILKVNASLRVPLMHGCRVWAIQRIWEMPVLMINAVTTVLTLSIQHRLHSETQLKSQMRRKSSLRLRSQAPPEENRKRKQRLQHRVNQNSMPRSSTKPSVCRPSPCRASHHSIWIYIACRGTTMITVTRT